MARFLNLAVMNVSRQNRQQRGSDSHPDNPDRQLKQMISIVQPGNRPLHQKGHKERIQKQINLINAGSENARQHAFK